MKKLIILFVILLTAFSCRSTDDDVLGFDPIPIGFDTNIVNVNSEAQDLTILAKTEFALSAVCYYSQSDAENAHWCEIINADSQKRECSGPWFEVSHTGKSHISNTLNVNLGNNDSGTARVLRIHVFRDDRHEQLYIYQSGRE